MFPLVDNEFGGHGSGSRASFAFDETVCFIRVHRHDGKVKTMYKTKFVAPEEGGFLPGNEYLDPNFEHGFEYFTTKSLKEIDIPEVQEIYASFKTDRDRHLRREFIIAFNRGCCDYQAKARGIDYAEYWGSRFDRVPGSIDDVFCELPLPGFSLPDLGPPFVNTLQQRKLELTKMEKLAEAQRNALFVLPVTSNQYPEKTAAQ